MGLYKICAHKERARDRCEHPWWGSFRGARVSLARWANREIRSKTEAFTVLEQLRATIRAGTFDPRGIDPPRESTGLSFREFADRYKQRHVVAKGLAAASQIDYRLRPLLERFGDTPLTSIKTADVEDFIADLKQPRVVNRIAGRRLKPASINRAIQLLRHMFNWAVGREYLERSPFRRGTEVLIRLELEDNIRRRRVARGHQRDHHRDRAAHQKLTCARTVTRSAARVVGAPSRPRPRGLDSWSYSTISRPRPWRPSAAIAIVR